MEQALASHLLALLAAYSASTGHAETTIAQRSAGDWRFFSRLREGSGFRVRTYDSVVAWFAAHWPDDLARPEGTPFIQPALERPAALEAAE